MSAVQSRLLVSVRSVEEAAAALLGGADLIDVKEPARGALGQADAATIHAVLESVGGRRPVSAALGELTAAPHSADLPHGLRFAKWGLAGWGRRDWQTAFQAAAGRLREQAPCCQPVVVAYADWQRAEAPAPDEVSAFARAQGYPLLIDTHTKDGTTLLDWLPHARLALLCGVFRNAGLSIALAGSLRAAAIAGLMPLRPDWFAVRGAACRQGRRDQAVSAACVQSLRDLLRAAPPVPA